MDYIPQLAQYANLYRQYRINWVKFSLLPNHDTYDGSQVTTQQGMPRIVWAINDSPALANPASEQDLLEDNGSKVRALTTMWTASCKPTPNIAVADATTTGLLPIVMKRRFLNFVPGNTGNPLHYGISYWISQSLAGGQPPGSFNLYMKINFSVRDPR